MLLLTQAFLFATAALIVVVLYKVLQALGRDGLFAGSRNGAPEPERVLMLVGTLSAVAGYVTQCLATSSQGSPHLVEPAEWMAWVLGGSHLSYLIGKAQRQR